MFEWIQSRLLASTPIGSWASLGMIQTPSRRGARQVSSRASKFECPDTKTKQVRILGSDWRMVVKQGWTGRVYEDFEVGDVYPHPLAGRLSPPTTFGLPC